MIIGAAILSLLSMATIVAFRKRHIINTITLVHILGVGLLALHTFLTNELPVYFFQSQMFYIDSLSMYEILLSSIVFFLSALYARGYVDSLLETGDLAAKNVPFYYGCFNLLFSAIIFSFCFNNLALTWICIELSTLLCALLIVVLNAKENIAAAMKYVFIVCSGMILTFVGVVLLFAISKTFGSGSLHWDALLANAASFPAKMFAFAFAFVFFGFAAKSGIVPFHAWLPVAHARAPSNISVLLSGSAVNAGMYGIIRYYTLGMQTGAATFIAQLLLVFGMASVAIACLCMIKRTNLKKLIAFSTIENNGFMLIGLGLHSTLWVFYYIAAHSLTKSLLFFSAGILRRQYGSSKIEYMHSPFRLQPFACVGLIVGIVAIAGTPLFPLFVSKFFILADLMQLSWKLVSIILLLMIIASASFLWFMVQVLRNAEKPLPRLNIPLSMHLPIILLCAIILILGTYIPEGLKVFLTHITQELKLVS